MQGLHEDQEWPSGISDPTCPAPRWTNGDCQRGSYTSTASGLKYEGDQRNFTFDKYVQLHMQQHNLKADLTDYGVRPLSENLTILWFKEGITDKSFEVVKINVIASPALHLSNMLLSKRFRKRTVPSTANNAQVNPHEPAKLPCCVAPTDTPAFPNPVPEAKGTVTDADGGSSPRLN